MARRVRKSRAQNERWNQMIQALRAMNFAFNNVRLYPPSHSEVVAVLNKLIEILTPILEEQEDVGFGFMDELLYIEGSMSIEETAANQMLVDRFSKCRVKYLTLMKGLAKEDLLAFFQILNAESIKPTDKAPGQQLEEKGVKTVHIVEADVDDTASKSKLAKKRTLLDWYIKAIDTLKAAQESIKAGGPVELKSLFRMIDDMTATIRSKGVEPYLLLPELSKGLDPHLAHSVNVGFLSCALGDLFGLNTGQINSLCQIAFLHDLGRLTIPVEWTDDHSPLHDAERQAARMHADWGYLLLTRAEELPPQVGLMAARHHEVGAYFPGYVPDVFHKILNMADTYDLAMFTDKYYWRKNRRDRDLLKLANMRGTTYDPTLVKLLIQMGGYFPVGSVVRLEDGRPGIVVRPNPANPRRPKIWLYEEAGEAPPPPATPDAAPEEAAPVILDCADFGEDGMSFRHGVAKVVDCPAGVDEKVLLDKKKEFLLSYTI